MKKIICFVILLYGLKGSAQSTYPIRADKVVIEKVGGSAELVLKNATRDSLHGILTNTGAGNTAFIRVKILNDSILVIGLDTVKIKGAYAKPITDVTRYVDYTNEVVVDSSFATACGYSVSNYTSISYPEFVGVQRVRVYALNRAPDQDNCQFGWFYNWDPSTGTVKLFPAYNFTDGSSAAAVTIETY